MAPSSARERCEKAGLRKSKWWGSCGSGSGPGGGGARWRRISERTIYIWRKRFGVLPPADVKRLRTLEQENARLKKLVAERDLELEVMKEINRKNGKRVRAPTTGGVCARTRFVAASVAVGGAFGIGISLAAGGAGCARNGQRYRARRARCTGVSAGQACRVGPPCGSDFRLRLPASTLLPAHSTR